MLFLHNYRYGAYSILVYQYVLTHYSVDCSWMLSDR